MVAVAMAESSLDEHAVSTACCMGLWQICEFHLSDPASDWPTLFSAAPNARWAVELSDNGAEYAAWDSCYTSAHLAAIASGASPRYSLSYPEAGSPVYGFIPLVAAALGLSAGGAGTGTAPAVPQPPEPNSYDFPPLPQPVAQLPAPGVAAFGTAWDSLTAFWNSAAPQLYDYYRNVQKSVNDLMKTN